MTDTELYRLVVSFSERFDKERSLEEYLRAFLRHLKNNLTQEPSVEEVFRWFEASFTTEPAPFEESWRQLAAPYEERERSCEEVLVMQIVDLRAMKESGTFENEQRYFGVQAPSQLSWYNFDPFTYTECAFRGGIGDGMIYEKTDEVDEDGFALAQAKENPKEVIGSWKLLEKLLWCGQLYE